MKGQIYKLTSPHTDMIYIGSTSVRLERRYNKHMNDNDCFSKILFKFGDVSIHLISEVEFETQLDLRKLEQIEMDKYDGKLCNDRRAYRTPECIKDIECKRRNSSYHKEWMSKYAKSDKYKEYLKEYHKSDKYKNNQNRKVYQKAYHTSEKAKKNKIINKEYKKSHFGILCKSYGIF